MNFKLQSTLCFAFGATLSVLAAFPANSSQFFSKKISDDLWLIGVVGDLITGDDKKFTTEALPLDNAIVAFDSNGGNLMAGINIGKAIRLKGFKTLVLDRNTCASACAIAWLGGAQRYMATGSHVGFHAAYLDNDGLKIPTATGNALVGAYMAQLGLSDTAIVYVTSAGPDDIQWLSFSDASRVSIDVKSFDMGDQPASPSVQSQPPAQEPLASTPPSSMSLEQQAMAFYSEYERNWSLDNASALPYLGSLYGDQIDYYGSIRPKTDVMAEKDKFAQRWPMRDYRPRPGTVSASCNVSRSECTVSGTLDWKAFNPAASITSVGVAEYQFVVTFAGAKPTIIGENGTVLKRNRTKN
ncbi:hypothetical protein [Labrys neptuniae]